MRTTILTHSDSDGICSGAIALARFPKANIFFTKPVSFYKDLKNTNSERIVICDIAITKAHAKEILKLINKKPAEILYFDHHPIPDNIKKEDINTIFVHAMGVSASELIFKYFRKDLPEERVWIAIYGAIGDYSEHTSFFKQMIKDWDKRALYFEVSTLVLGIKNREFDTYDAKRNIASILARGGNPSDVPGLVRSAKRAVTREFKLYEWVKKNAKKSGNIGYVKHKQQFGFRGALALFAATVTSTSVGLCVHEIRNHLDITARSRKGIPLNTLMEQAAEWVNGSGGGHAQAAGARISINSLDKFLEKANNLIK